MYLLYLDGSGSVRNPAERHFVLAGIAVFERQIYHLITKTDEFVATLGLGPVHEVELHASVMNNGRKRPWKGVRRQDRLIAIENGLELLRNAHWSVKAFAVAVDKQAVSPDDPVERAFEEICNRFNLFLARLLNREGNRQRGLVVMDKSNYEDTLQGLARHFRDEGTRWGNLRNLAEVPMFVDSTASRLIQIADLLAWAVWRRYEHGDTRYFDRVAHRFDAEGGVIHGLVHFSRSADECRCPACLSRAFRLANDRPPAQP
ncbi:MAG: DUF3800 domain-containing protein [Defluviicoccus sp.]|nr:DUF3800 domain-containing protein [Defluviicoccus sp.]